MSTGCANERMVLVSEFWYQLHLSGGRNGSPVPVQTLRNSAMPPSARWTMRPIMSGEGGVDKIVGGAQPRQRSPSSAPVSLL
jgi:hypothetical protein